MDMFWVKVGLTVAAIFAYCFIFAYLKQACSEWWDWLLADNVGNVRETVYKLFLCMPILAISLIVWTLYVIHAVVFVYACYSAVKDTIHDHKD